MLITYNKPLTLKIEKGHGGYVYFIDHEHPLCNSVGRVYLHRHIASITAGRWLNSSEHVHHINNDKADNCPGNLVVITRSEHARIHRKPLDVVQVVCLQCGNTFTTTRKTAVTCSNKCSGQVRRKFEITSEELSRLVWEMPTVQVAHLCGVTDKAVEKRCRLLGINKPPRGYWAIKRAQVCPLPTKEVKG